ncbi:MAG: hypothetical protein JRF33_13565 [Deltaproteobacteria bacterium]|nr:hypothetical protein [Deltaproteobacteria bacterium]
MDSTSRGGQGVVSIFACALVVVAWAGLLSCEDPPLPMPPADFDKMEALNPTPEAASRMAQKKADEGQVVLDDAVRLRWILAEEEKARAFRVRFSPSKKGNRRFRFDPKRQTKLSGKARRYINDRNQRGGKLDLFGILRRKDATYGSLAMDYYLGPAFRKRLPKNKKLDAAINDLVSKPVVSAEIAKSGAVISVDTPFEITSISADGIQDRGVALETSVEGDLTLHTILLEMPPERVKVGDEWSFQLRHVTDLMLQKDKVDEKVVVKLVKLEEKDGRVLAHLRYNIRVKIRGKWMKLSPNPIPQTFTTVFKGRGVFDATLGSWHSFRGRFSRSGRGVMDFASSMNVKITPLKKVPKGLSGEQK